MAVVWIQEEAPEEWGKKSKDEEESWGISVCWCWLAQKGKGCERYSEACPTSNRNPLYNLIHTQFVESYIVNLNNVVFLKYN